MTEWRRVSVMVDDAWSSEITRVPVVCSAGVRPAVHTVPPVSLPWPVSGRALSVPGWPVRRKHVTKSGSHRHKLILYTANKLKRHQKARLSDHNWPDVASHPNPEIYITGALFHNASLHLNRALFCLRYYFSIYTRQFLSNYLELFLYNSVRVGVKYKLCPYLLVSGALLMAMAVTMPSTAWAGSAAVSPPPLPGAWTRAAPVSWRGARAPPSAITRTRPERESSRFTL